MLRLRTLLIVMALMLAAVLGVLSLRALEPSATPVATAPAVATATSPAALERLAQAIRLQTISRDYPDTASAFDDFHNLLHQAFPRTHATLRREVVAGHSLLYTWPGRDPEAPALVLMAHQDVVPVDADRLPHWQHPPFAGVVADGFLWGRGTLDDKSSLMALLEAVESLLAEGFQPAQTVHFAFGHDEETSGSGAAAIAALLAERGPPIGLVLDEGLTLTEGLVAGVSRPVALVGVAEKGYLNITLRARAAGGHSSMPPQDTAIGRLALAIEAVRTHPMPARLQAPVVDMVLGVGAQRSWIQRVALGNLWLFEPLVRTELETTPAGQAMLRTTITPTIVRGGLKDNVLPQSAEAVLNVRLLPGDRSADVVAHLRRVIDDAAIEILRSSDVREATPIADTTGPAFDSLAQRINDVFPDALVVPGLMVGGADARHFTPLTPNVYRFQPVRVTPDDLSRFHGDDERIAPGAYRDMIRFYAALMREGLATHDARRQP